jgi:hypothetical protein
VKLNWQDIAAVAAVWTVLTGVLIFVFRPLLDRNWLATFERNKVEIKAKLDGWYETSSRQQLFTKLQNDHADLYRRFGEMIEMNEVQATRVTETIERVVKDQNDALRHISDQVADTARSVSYIYGMLKHEPWDGRTERRHGERRD